MTNKEYSSAPVPQCKHYDICGRDSEGNPADGLCILHSTDAAKDAHAFAEALATHRECKGNRFFAFVFPGGADFRRVTLNEADFTGATFSGRANFRRVTFNEADFTGATFSGNADFRGATFSARANFTEVAF